MDDNNRPRPYWVVAAVYVGIAILMLCLAIFRQEKGSPLLCFVLFVACLALAVREIYFYFRDKKAGKD